MSATPVTCGMKEDSRCEDLEFAADNPSICPDAPTITGLRVSPSSGEVEVNSKYPFAAYLTFSDGREKNVTEKAAWSSSNGNIAEVDTGICTGKSVGVVTVEATYRGLFDFGQLTVVAQCFQVGMDIVLLFDRSASMLTKGPDGTTRIDQVKAAAKAFVANCFFTKDQVSVISFAGVYETAADGTLTRHPDTTEHLVLSQSVLDIEAAIDSVAVNEPCLYDLPDGGSGNRCATGIGGGLQTAKEELSSSRARSDTRKVVVLLTDGVENVCSPDPVVVSDEMKSLNWVIVVIAASVPDSLSLICGVKKMARTYLSGLCSCDLFFTADDAGALTDIYSRVPSIICKNQLDECFYYFAPPTGNPPPPVSPRDTYDYHGLRNWNVEVGVVDLIGVDLWPSLADGHGLVIRMAGAAPASLALIPTQIDHFATIRTKQRFVFGVGQYRLSISLRGNGGEPGTTDTVTIKIGTMLNKTVTLDADYQNTTGWQDFSWTFSPSASAQESILILTNHKGHVWTVGPLIDAVKLENIDTGEETFFDDFDSENQSP